MLNSAQKAAVFKKIFPDENTVVLPTRAAISLNNLQRFDMTDPQVFTQYGLHPYEKVRTLDYGACIIIGESKGSLWDLKTKFKDEGVTRFFPSDEDDTKSHEPPSRQNLIEMLESAPQLLEGIAKLYPEIMQLTDTPTPDLQKDAVSTKDLIKYLKIFTAEPLILPLVDSEELLTFSKQDEKMFNQYRLTSGQYVETSEGLGRVIGLHTDKTGQENLYFLLEKNTIGKTPGVRPLSVSENRVIATTDFSGFRFMTADLYNRIEQLLALKKDLQVQTVLSPKTIDTAKHFALVEELPTHAPVDKPISTPEKYEVLFAEIETYLEEQALKIGKIRDPLVIAYHHLADAMMELKNKFDTLSHTQRTEAIKNMGICLYVLSAPDESIFVKKYLPRDLSDYAKFIKKYQARFAAVGVAPCFAFVPGKPTHADLITTLNTNKYSLISTPSPAQQEIEQYRSARRITL